MYCVQVKNADTIMSQAFGVDKQQDTYVLKNVVSRKKQFLRPLWKLWSSRENGE